MRTTYLYSRRRALVPSRLQHVQSRERVGRSTAKWAGFVNARRHLNTYLTFWHPPHNLIREANRFDCPVSLTTEQQDGLMRSVEHCLVKNTLLNPIQIEVSLEFHTPQARPLRESDDGFEATVNERGLGREHTEDRGRIFSVFER